MMTGWFILGLVLTGTTLIVASRGQRRTSTKSLDRAFDRARRCRTSGGMHRDRLY